MGGKGELCNAECIRFLDAQPLEHFEDRFQPIGGHLKGAWLPSKNEGWIVKNTTPAETAFFQLVEHVKEKRGPFVNLPHLGIASRPVGLQTPPRHVFDDDTDDEIDDGSCSLYLSEKNLAEIRDILDWVPLTKNICFDEGAEEGKYVEHFRDICRRQRHITIPEDTSTGDNETGSSGVGTDIENTENRDTENREQGNALEGALPPHDVWGGPMLAEVGDSTIDTSFSLSSPLPIAHAVSTPLKKGVRKVKHTVEMLDYTHGLETRSALCILDIKIGRKLWGPNTHKDKVENLSRKLECCTLKKTGLRLVAYQIGLPPKIGVSQNRIENGRSPSKTSSRYDAGFDLPLNPGPLGTQASALGHDSLRQKTSSAPLIWRRKVEAPEAGTIKLYQRLNFFLSFASREVLEELRAKTHELLEIIARLTFIHFHSTSLLIIYSRQKNTKEHLRFKLIDFAHVSVGHKSVDQKFLQGLCTLEAYLHGLTSAYSLPLVPPLQPPYPSLAPYLGEREKEAAKVEALRV